MKDPACKRSLLLKDHRRIRLAGDGAWCHWNDLWTWWRRQWEAICSTRPRFSLATALFLETYALKKTIRNTASGKFHRAYFASMQCISNNDLRFCFIDSKFQKLQRVCMVCNRYIPICIMITLPFRLTRSECLMFLAYGLTECGGICCVSPLDRTAHKPGAAGVPLPSVEMKASVNLMHVFHEAKRITLLMQSLRELIVSQFDSRDLWICMIWQAWRFGEGVKSSVAIHLYMRLMFYFRVCGTATGLKNKLLDLLSVSILLRSAPHWTVCIYFMDAYGQWNYVQMAKFNYSSFTPYA